MTRKLKAQGSIEYLIPFAVILTISLIVIFLLGKSSDYSNDIVMEKSLTYWKSKHPIAITDVKSTPWTNTAGIVFTLKNVGMEKVEILWINTSEGRIILMPLSNADICNSYSTYYSICLQPGEQKAAYLEAIQGEENPSTGCSCDESMEIGEIKKVLLKWDKPVIYYKKSSGGDTIFKEAGDQPLYAYCICKKVETQQQQ